MTRRLTIATRGSALALAQTGMIGAELTRHTGVDVTITVVTTQGDTSRASLASIGGTGVFASALRAELAAGTCDLVVHSLKDLPTASYPGLALGAIPLREDPRDALCARDGLTLAELPEGSRIGTGSPRRVAQLLSLRPDVTVIDIRGNVDTRLAKVSSGELDAVVLAAAGLARLQRLDAVSELFDLAIWPTAPGQGALAIEVREEDSIPELATIEDPGTRMSITAERAVLAALEAGCSAPVGASAVLEGDTLRLTAVVYSADGTGELGSTQSVAGFGGASAGGEVGSSVSDSALVEAAAALGSAVARQLLDDGAGELVQLGGAA